MARDSVLAYTVYEPYTQRYFNAAMQVGSVLWFSACVQEFEYSVCVCLLNEKIQIWLIKAQSRKLPILRFLFKIIFFDNYESRVTYNLYYHVSQNSAEQH